MLNSFNIPVILNLNVQSSKHVNNNSKSIINMCLINSLIFMSKQFGQNL